jgi:hypothetical protein
LAFDGNQVLGLGDRGERAHDAATARCDSREHLIHALAVGRGTADEYDADGTRLHGPGGLGGEFPCAWLDPHTSDKL